MTAAVAGGGAAKALPPPVPSLGLPDYAAAKALTYLCLASLWVGGACLAAAALADLASAAGASGVVGFPLVSALLKLSTEAVQFGALLVLVVVLLLLRAAFRLVVTGLRFRVDMEMGIDKIPRESVRSVLMRDTPVIGWLATLPFILLSVVGCFAMIVLPPAKGSLMDRISTVVFDVGIVGSMVLSCFVTIPSTALKVWRMSWGVEGLAPADSVV